VRTPSLRGATTAGAVALALLLPACRDDAPPATEEGSSSDAADSTAGEEADSVDSGSGSGGEPGDDGPAPIYLGPTEHLVRVSMALRGVRPSAEELAAVEADPEAIEGIVDGYLDDPRFGTIVRDLHNDALLVLADFLVFPAGFLPKGPVADVDVYRLNRSITEAPLRLVEHVVMTDRPYTEIVTAEYTLADQIVADVWGVPYEGNGSTWEVTSWQDERDQAGILSDPWLFQRYQSTVSNANRGRANAISRALLCYDFLSRDIEVDASVNLADPDAVANAVVENPACASCHQGLDPLAGFLRDWAPVYVPSDVEYPFDSYMPGVFEDIGATVRDSNFFGRAGEGLGDLGRFIAEDPRFSLCAAQRFYAYFHQVEVEDVPLEVAARLQTELVDSGMSAKALARAIVLDDEFRVSHADPADPGENDPVGVKKARPVQLSLLFDDLTGFRWRTDLTEFDLAPIDLLDDSFLGYNVLMGGIDSLFVTRPSHTYSATASLGLRSLSREAANFVVDEDFAEPDLDARRLLTRVTPTDTDEDLVREQIAVLHLRILAHSVEPDGPEVSATYELFQAALDHSSDVTRAWKVTLTALLQDVEIAYY
jgi:hypothetical protein